MPILPPDRSTFGGDEKGRDGGRRRRRVGGGGSGDEAPDTREVTCTTGLQHFPSNETLMTERGATCGPCQLELEAAAPPRSPKAALVAAAVVGGVVLVGIVVAVVAWSG